MLTRLPTTGFRIQNEKKGDAYRMSAEIGGATDILWGRSTIVATTAVRNTPTATCTDRTRTIFTGRLVIGWIRTLLET